MKTCLIHSQAMTYSDPTHPSPEGEIIAQAAHELFEKHMVDSYAIFVNSVIKGVRECDVLVARLEQLGITRKALIIEPVADTTDAEFETFAKYADEHSLKDVAVLSIEAKRGRLEAIARRSHFFPLIYWAEDVLASSDNQPMIKLVTDWRKSFRHVVLRLRLGIVPRTLMTIDPQAKLQRNLARAIRHQK